MLSFQVFMKIRYNRFHVFKIESGLSLCNLTEFGPVSSSMLDSIPNNAILPYMSGEPV